MAPSPPSSTSGRLTAGRGGAPLSAPSAPSASGRLAPEPAEWPRRPFWREVLRRLWWWAMLAAVLACAAKGGGAFIYQQF